MSKPNSYTTLKLKIIFFDMHAFICYHHRQSIWHTAHIFCKNWFQFCPIRPEEIFSSHPWNLLCDFESYDRDTSTDFRLGLCLDTGHTYIISHYNPSVRIIDLVSHAAYIVCVNFIHKWRDLQFKVDSERQIFWETFHGSFNLLSEFLPEICWEEISVEILFIFLLMSGLGLEPWPFV